MKWKNGNPVDRDAFAAAMLRHMVRTKVGGKLDKPEYNRAMSEAIRVHNLKSRHGEVDLRGKSVGYLAYVCGLIVGNILTDRAAREAERVG